MQTRTALLGAACAVGATFCFSFNDLTVKWLSGSYPLHELTLLRSALGLVLILGLLVPLMGGYRTLRTRRPLPHIARGLCVVLANGFFFLGLAELGLADAVAIFFISPLVITIFSVVFLRERVGPRRWFAVLIGLIGVMIMVKPGTSAFTPYALLPMVAAVCYASLHMLTRMIGGTESALTMTFYIQFTFLLSSIAIGLGLGDGRFDVYESASLQFLFRSWTVPGWSDVPFFVVMGVCSTAGGFLISQAYKLSEAAFVAPFEYLTLPLAIFWGYLIFDDWPTPSEWVGISLIIGSGLYMVYRETRTQSPARLLPKARR